MSSQPPEILSGRSRSSAAAQLESHGRRGVLLISSTNFDDASGIVGDLTRLLEGQAAQQDVLERVVRLSVGAVGDCGGAAVTSFENSAPADFTVSDEPTGRLHEVLLALDDGPVRAAWKENRLVKISPISPDDMPPEFVTAAADCGLRSLACHPIPGDGGPWGVLTLYSVGAITEEGLKAGTFLADHVSVVVHDARLYSDCLTLVTQLSEALGSRAVIDQAKGILMSRELCSADEAFDMLRRASQQANRKLREVAEEVVSRASNGDAK